MEAEAPEFTRHCEWSGEDRPGKHYVLTTTEGRELVSAEAFRPVDPGVLADLHRRVMALTRRVHQLESAAAGAVDVEAPAAKVPGDVEDVEDVEAPAAKVPAQRRRGSRG